MTKGKTKTTDGRKDKKGQDAEESKGLGQVMWQIGVAWVIQNVLEQQKIEKHEVPWQPTFLFEDGTHSDSERLSLYKYHYKYHKERFHQYLSVII